jgi:hypothetical protein
MRLFYHVCAAFGVTLAVLSLIVYCLQPDDLSKPTSLHQLFWVVWPFSLPVLVARFGFTGRLS